MLNGLDLFSGIGGLSVALAPWVRPIAYCESDRFCHGVLVSRFVDGLIPSAPIWDDVRTLSGSALAHVGVDIVYGGFPCQDISVAGGGAGLAGERSGLVSEVFRLVGELRPRFVFLENVPAIRSREADVVVGQLAALGYDARWDVLSAFDVGAPHKRERWWLLAHGHGHGLEIESECDSEKQTGAGPQRSTADGFCHAVPDTASCRLPLAGGVQKSDAVKRRGEAVAERHGLEGSIYAKSWEGAPVVQRRPSDSRWWAVEPDVGRVAHGVPKRVDRLRGLGNAVVPAQAREAFRRLAGLE